jgi:hypothetical protein
MLAFACFGAIMSVVSQTRAADDCDPLGFRNTKIALKDTWEQIAYLNASKEHHEGSSAGSVGGNLFDYLSLNGDSRSNYLNELSNLLKLDLQESDKRFLFLSGFDNDGRLAYEQCLQKNTPKFIFITPSKNAAASPVFSVQVKLRKLPVDTRVNAVVTIVTGGTILSSPGWTLKPNVKQASGRMHDGSAISVVVSRDVASPFEMTVTAGDENETMTLPAPPTTKLIEETRYSNVVPVDCNGCDIPSNRKDFMSIDLSAGELILPRSEQIKLVVKGSPFTLSPNATGPAFKDVSVDKYSETYRPHELTIPVDIGYGKDGHFCAKWVTSVKVIVPVPAGAASSGRQQPLPSLDCTYK